MRVHGSVAELPAPGSADHLCWVHDDDAAFDEAVGAFLAGGLALGERLLCVGERAIAALDGTTVLGDVDALVADGALETLTVAQAYAATGPLAVDRQRAFYDAASRRALDDGYRGLRVVAELSDLARDPAQREELVRWEQAGDEFMASGSGMSALCAYRSDLPDSALGDLMAVHPQAHGARRLQSFRLFSDRDGLVLTGSVDAFSGPRLAALLAGTPTGASAVLDLGDLEFVDVAGCRALAGWAAALHDRGVPLEIRGASPLLLRMWSLLQFDDLAPVTFADTRG